MSSIYVHIPFCLRKCAYCEFYSVTSEDVDFLRFIQAVETEAKLRSAFFNGNEPIETVYLGGGTPSLLDPDTIEILLDTLNIHFPFSENCEFSIEMNPRTINPEILDRYNILGINRISIGVQSFRDDELNLLGRIHDGREAEEACRIAGDATIDNVGFDLIYGLPVQTPEEWAETLKKTVAYAPTHVSTYELTWSRKTALGRAIESEEIARPDVDTSCEMFLLADKILTETGYEHYEISNYALPGYRCRHNEGTWTHEPYLGLGPSAHSYDGKSRSWNDADLEAYTLALSQQRLPPRQQDRLNPDRRRLECIGIGLRRSDGIPMSLIADKKDEIAHLLNTGLARLEDHTFRLTPSGFLLADEICLRLNS